MTEILSKLKELTAPYHIKLEENPYAKAIMDNRLTIDEYRAYLEKFYTFLSPLEAIFEQRTEWSERGFDFEPRRKLDLLEQDLQALGASEAELRELPRCTKLPELSTFPQVLGSLYVWEGSTLGGQIITKKLQSYLPIEPAAGGSYFYSYGPDTRTRWQEFRELLTAEITSEEAVEEAVAAASDTFRLFDQWLAEKPESVTSEP
ncbi:biliverdin-producing heme oxygenase [Paenibacillus filicis]|uniref:Biliverdin-producing heme oxygenase n=1 Tax=Paenibacillus filicis TaxID=669464 RepID=A0ABU9DGY6_9BACL